MVQFTHGTGGVEGVEVVEVDEVVDASEQVISKKIFVLKAKGRHYSTCK